MAKIMRSLSCKVYGVEASDIDTVNMAAFRMIQLTHADRGTVKQEELRECLNPAYEVISKMLIRHWNTRQRSDVWTEFFAPSALFAFDLELRPILGTFKIKVCVRHSDTVTWYNIHCTTKDGHTLFSRPHAPGCDRNVHAI